MNTMWFEKPANDPINSTFPYKSWKDFTECKPHKLWKPYILSSWSWKKFSVDNVNPYKIKKQRDQKKHVLDCGDILRVNPSDYEKAKPLFESIEKDVEMLQIVFISPDRFSGLHRVEVCVKPEDEDAIRDWLKNHMPTFWKL